MKIQNDTRVYIAGCGGMLGEAVFERFSSRAEVLATDIDLNTDWLQKADVRDYAEMEQSITEFRPDLIINLAALTDLEYCEKNPDNAWSTNALGAENLALIASKLNVPLAPGADDAEFRMAWRQVEAYLDAAKPEFILFQCGADSLEGDPITHLCYSEQAHADAAFAIFAVTCRGVASWFTNLTSASVTSSYCASSLREGPTRTA